MILVVFLMVYLLTGIPLVVWVGVDGTLAALLAIPVAFALACLFAWLRPGRERRRVAKNRTYLFDLHIKSCREYIEAIESEGGADPIMLKVNMAMIHHKLRDALRVGYPSEDRLQAYNEVEGRFLRLEREHDLDFRDYEL